MVLMNSFFYRKITQSCEELLYLASEKGLELYVELDNNHQTIISDRLKLELILNNLVMNAIKFTSKGHIKITTRTGESAYEICVEDTGIGIDKEYFEYIFEKFTQIDQGIRRKYGGTGLGLSIVKTMVDCLQGKILLESEPGLGSKFNLIFPVNLHTDE